MGRHAHCLEDYSNNVTGPGPVLHLPRTHYWEVLGSVREAQYAREDSWSIHYTGPGGISRLPRTHYWEKHNNVLEDLGIIHYTPFKNPLSIQNALSERLLKLNIKL
jgi:hypothetical protein